MVPHDHQVVTKLGVVSFLEVSPVREKLCLLCSREAAPISLEDAHTSVGLKATLLTNAHDRIHYEVSCHGGI